MRVHLLVGDKVAAKCVRGTKVVTHCVWLGSTSTTLAFRVPTFSDIRFPDEIDTMGRMDPSVRP